MSRNAVRAIFIWVLIAVTLAVVFSKISPKISKSKELTYTEFLNNLTAKRVKNVTITDGNLMTGKLSDGKSFSSYIPIFDPTLLPNLVEKKVEIIGKPPEKSGFFQQFILQVVSPLVLFIGFIYFLSRQQMRMGGKGGGAFPFGKSKARMLGRGQVKETFKDVAGCDEAKEEVKELIEFLKDPGRFTKLGGKLPKGVLLVGQPGTGKTLLAKAVAGEARVPFFSISGSDFVEMFVGVGASRVRDMFEQARKNAPCIIFIDELDAVGRHRGAGLGGGHDEREQTLNQLLVEMDGFLGKEGIIILAATNRPDVLDPALLRPGRFDRQVVIGLPDLKGREEILQVHRKGKPMGRSVNMKIIARTTSGFSGADLANLLNEAALIGARDKNRKEIRMADLEQARDRIIMGLKRSLLMSDEEKRLTAYHEAGHTIAALLAGDHDPVYKVTIIPHGLALGSTVFVPLTDAYSITKRKLHSRIVSGCGGRAAEELIFGPDLVTTGAANDIQYITDIARKMVMKWGLSSQLGPISYGEEEKEVFLGQKISQTKEISDKTAEEIDREVKKLVEGCYQEAIQLLKKNLQALHRIAKELIARETLSEKEVQELLHGSTSISKPKSSNPEDSPSIRPLRRRKRTTNSSKTNEKVKSDETEKD